MEEIWVDIKEYEGLYQVSNFGDIRNHKGKILSRVKNNGNSYFVSTVGGAPISIVKLYIENQKTRYEEVKEKGWNNNGRINNG